MNGFWLSRVFSIPTIINLYNWLMGGTDSQDQRLSYYRPHLKSISWVPRMLCHLLNVSVVNAYILFKEYHGKGKGYHLIEFIEALIEQLSIPFILERKQLKSGSADELVKSARQWQSRSTWEKKYLDRIGGQHECVMTKAAEPSTSNAGFSRNLLRGKCILCGSDVATRCKQCAVHLCITEDPTNCRETCFHIFHNDKTFPDASGLKMKTTSNSESLLHYV